MSADQNNTDKPELQPGGDGFVVSTIPTIAPADAATIELVPSDLDAAAVDDSLVLELTDLLPDAAGEVVLFFGDGLPINLRTDEAITGTGIADSHVTATGVDVTGLHFYSFESGITVYSLSDVLIVQGSEHA
ncbi:MAG: hypothetical protein ACREDZ_05655 [Kiloniellales bacterium]